MLTDSAESKGRLDVKVLPVDLRRANSAQDSGMECYPMCRNPRGQALIIEIEDFVNEVQEKREGSQVNSYLTGSFYRPKMQHKREPKNYADFVFYEV